MYSLLFGILVGIAFTACGLKAPAPDNLNAIYGIIGIYLGPILYTQLPILYRYLLG